MTDSEFQSNQDYTAQLDVSFREAVWKAVLGERTAYCRVPIRYRSSTFELDDPSETQQRAISLFELLLDGNACTDGNPLLPEQGVYLHGPVGTGKTHLLSAYANVIYEKLQEEEQKRKTEVEKKIDALVRGFAGQRKNSYDSIKRKFDKSIKDAGEKNRPNYYDSPKFDEVNLGMQESCSQEIQKAGEEADGQFTQDYDALHQSLTQSIDDAVAYLARDIRENFMSETDMVFLGFEELLRIRRENTTALEEIITTPLLFLDDVHPKGDAERAKVVQELLERRYENNGRATFVTSNLSPEELVNVGNYDEKIAQRIVSRCKEMFYIIDTSDARDFREIIGNRRKAGIDKLLLKRKKSAHAPQKK